MVEKIIDLILEGKQKCTVKNLGEKITICITSSFPLVRTPHALPVICNNLKMKQILVLFLALPFLHKCQNESIRTYEMGFQFCTDLFVINGGEGIYPRVNCIEGSKLPKFEFETIEKKVITDEQLEGKPSVINFWFIGCAPCEAEVPGLQMLNEKYDQKVNFIAIGRNSKKNLDQFLDKNKWDFMHVNDPEGSLIYDTFNFEWGYPTTFIVNKKGIIKKAFSGVRSKSSASEFIINEIEPTLKALINE